MNTAQLDAPDTPVVERPAKSVSTRLRCFVHAVGPKCYLAECIDLDISAEGATEKEARRGLREAMLGYISVACEGQSVDDFDEKSFRKLILRPSPVRHRLHYYVGKITQAAFRKKPTRCGDRFYTLPAPCGGY
jgi:hypothetical protein